MHMHFSLDLRERVVALLRKGEHTTNQIARIFGISRTTVQSYDRMDRQTGDLRPKKREQRRSTLDKPGVREAIYTVFKERNDAKLVEYRDAIERNCGIRLSLFSICVYLQKLDLRRKKKTFTHQNAIPRQRSRSVNSSVAT
jgi:transposase